MHDLMSGYRDWSTKNQLPSIWSEINYYKRWFEGITVARMKVKRVFHTWGWPPHPIRGVPKTRTWIMCECETLMDDQVRHRKYLNLRHKVPISINEWVLHLNETKTTGEVS